MEIVPVLDLRDGVAVHAVAGDRANYRIVESRLGHGSDPVSLAQAMMASVGARSLYVADLGAIMGGRGHEELLLELAVGLFRPPRPHFPKAGASGQEKPNRRHCLYWDAGLTTHNSLPIHPSLTPIWASETANPIALAENPPTGPAAFSVDLAGGIILGDWRAWNLSDNRDVAGLAAAGVKLTGADSVIVLDLKGVGVRGGPIDGETVAKIRARLPAEVRLGVGGGVRHDDDLTRLEQLGVEFVLISTAIHDGSLTACRRDTTDE